MWLTLSVPQEWILFLRKPQLRCNLEMNVCDLQCSVSVQVLQWFLLAEVLLCSMGWQEHPGGCFCARILGLLWLLSGHGLASCSLSHGRPGHPHSALCCVFIMCSDELHVCCQGRPRPLVLVGLHSFLLQRQPWLLTTSSGAVAFAGEALAPAVPFVSPAFLLHT